MEVVLFFSRIVRGGNNIVDGPLGDGKTQEIMARVAEGGFGHKKQEVKDYLLFSSFHLFVNSEISYFVMLLFHHFTSSSFH